MLIIGAKGFAKEVLEVFSQNKELENIAFFDNVNTDIGDFLYDKFRILKTYDEVKHFFDSNGPEFTIGIGNPQLRKMLYDEFVSLGGVFSVCISPFAKIGNFGNIIEQGVNIMTDTIITNDVKIGKGVLINLSCTVGHDSIIGNFVELCPDVNVSGNCKIGELTFIGTNSVILPKVTIGKNVIVGAGSVVTKDLPDNVLAFGAPAKVIKSI
jgi:sugar O-acyltransferase (sialic acid O-acetyltransferase NeuD family)